MPQGNVANSKSIVCGKSRGSNPPIPSRGSSAVSGFRAAEMYWTRNEQSREDNSAFLRCSAPFFIVRWPWPFAAVRDHSGAAQLRDTDLSPKKAPVPRFCLYSVVFSWEKSRRALYAVSKPRAASLRSKPQKYLVSAD